MKRIKDRKGIEHGYDVTPHEPFGYSGMTGIELASRVGAYLTPILAELFGDELDTDDSAADALAKARGFDMQKIGGHVAAALKDLDPRLIKEMFRNTIRDGIPLESDAAFNNAYRGDYIEMARAIAHIAEVNGWIPFGDILGTTESQPKAAPAPT